MKKTGSIMKNIKKFLQNYEIPDACPRPQTLRPAGRRANRLRAAPDPSRIVKIKKLEGFSNKIKKFVQIMKSGPFAPARKRFAQRAAGQSVCGPLQILRGS